MGCANSVDDGRAQKARDGPKSPPTRTNEQDLSDLSSGQGRSIRASLALTDRRMQRQERQLHAGGSGSSDGPTPRMLITALRAAQMAQSSSSSDAQQAMIKSNGKLVPMRTGHDRRQSQPQRGSSSCGSAAAPAIASPSSAQGSMSSAGSIGVGAASDVGLPHFPPPTGGGVSTSDDTDEGWTAIVAPSSV